MTDEPPIDGEVKPPKPGKPSPGFGRTSKQTPEQREAEEKAAEVWGKLAISGGFQRDEFAYIPTDEERDQVRIMVFCGYAEADIAAITRMGVETLRKYFSFELRNGRRIAIADLAQRAFHRARGGDATLTMFLLKTRGEGAFSEKAQIVAGLDDALGAETDEAKRKQLVTSIMELISPKMKPKPKETTTVATPTPQKGSDQK